VSPAAAAACAAFSAESELRAHPAADLERRFSRHAAAPEAERSGSSTRSASVTMTGAICSVRKICSQSVLSSTSSAAAVTAASE
jgi:hypothetical protein